MSLLLGLKKRIGGNPRKRGESGGIGGNTLIFGGNKGLHHYDLNFTIEIQCKKIFFLYLKLSN